MSDVARSKRGSAIHLAPPGPLTTDVAIESLRQMLEACIARDEIHIIVNFSKVALINSAALECLLDSHDQLTRMGGELKIGQANTIVHDVLNMTGVTDSIQFSEGRRQRRANVITPIRPDVPMRLGERCIVKGLVTEEQISKAIGLQSKTGRRLGQILQDQGLVSEQDLLSVLSEQLALPFALLRTGLFDPDVVGLLGKIAARSKTVVPLFSIRGTLYLATSDPQDIPALDAIAELTRRKISPVLATSDNISDIINEAYADNHDLSEYIGELDSDTDLEIIKQEPVDDFVTIDEVASGSPVINLINGLIQRAVRDGVSDIHIEPLRHHCRIRFRIDGVLYPAMSPPADIQPALVSRLKVMADLDIAERRMPQDGRIQVYTHGRTIDLRFSSLPGLFGEKIVLRVLDKTETVTNVDKLGMNEKNLETYKRLLERSFGLILVTGPTGSGKTTTLYAALNYLSSPEKSLVTIEDPVEYQLDMINQNQVRENIGLSFSTVLRHILRQDPDIIMVGEIRDKETAEIAVQASLTGHLVLATLHTNDSAGAITRLLDIGVEPFLLSSALIGVFAQRLVRTICPDCKTQFVAPPGSLKRFGVADERVHLSKGRGCAACYDSGYRGRIAVHEVLEPDTEIQRIMISNPSRDELTRQAQRLGAVSMLDDGIQRALAGKTTIEEVTRVVNI